MIQACAKSHWRGGRGEPLRTSRNERVLPFASAFWSLFYVIFRHDVTWHDPVAVREGEQSRRSAATRTLDF